MLGSPTKSQIEAVSAEAPVCLFRCSKGCKWWVPVDNPLSADKDDSIQFSAFAKVNLLSEPVVMDEQFNSAVTDIFRNEYLSLILHITLRYPTKVSVNGAILCIRWILMIPDLLFRSEVLILAEFLSVLLLRPKYSFHPCGIIIRIV